MGLSSYSISWAENCILKCPKKTYLNNCPNSVCISPSRSSQRMSCTLQMLYCLEDLPSPREACTAYSQAINLVQSKPKLAVQIAKASFVVIPRAVKIHRPILPLLKHCPTSTSGFLITVHFKFAQTIRIDFVHSTYLGTGLVKIGAVLINYNIVECSQKFIRLLRVVFSSQQLRE